MVRNSPLFFDFFLSPHPLPPGNVVVPAAGYKLEGPGDAFAGHFLPHQMDSCPRVAALIEPKVSAGPYLTSWRGPLYRSKGPVPPLR